MTRVIRQRCVALIFPIKKALPSCLIFKIIDHQLIVSQTQNWIKSVVIGCNFCPFALPVVKENRIRYVVLPQEGMVQCKTELLQELKHLDAHPETETTFIIFSRSFVGFPAYLQLVKWAEGICKQKKYDGIYQIASFHPEYRFQGLEEDDAANYTNRSIYPMLHLLRESSLRRVLKHFPDPAQIPVNNIAYARKRGLEYMEWLRATSLT